MLSCLYAVMIVLHEIKLIDCILNIIEQVLDERAGSQARPSYETPMSGASQLSESLLEEDKVNMAANPVSGLPSGRESNIRSSPDAYIAWAKKIHLFFNERLFLAAEQANLIAPTVDDENVQDGVHIH